MRHRPAVLIGLALLSCVLVGPREMCAQGRRASIKAYVLDSACAFTKSLKKPISADCALACAKAGSPLVLLTDDGTVYWPISDAMPARGQNDKLLEFAGKKVSVTGRVYRRGGSQAIVIAKIEPMN